MITEAHNVLKFYKIIIIARLKVRTWFYSNFLQILNIFVAY